MPVELAVVLKAASEVSKLVSNGKVDIKLGSKSKKIIDKAFWIKASGQLIVKDKADGEYYQIADLGNNVSGANTDAWVKAFNKIENYVAVRSEQLLQQKKNDVGKFDDFIEKATGVAKDIAGTYDTVKNTWGTVKDIFDGNSGGTGGGGGAPPPASTEWYKNPLVWIGVGVAVLFFFGKKLKSLFR